MWTALGPFATRCAICFGSRTGGEPKHWVKLAMSNVENSEGFNYTLQDNPPQAVSKEDDRSAYSLEQSVNRVIEAPPRSVRTLLSGSRL